MKDPIERAIETIQFVYSNPENNDDLLSGAIDTLQQFHKDHIVIRRDEVPEFLPVELDDYKNSGWAGPNKINMLVETAKLVAERMK